MGLYDSLSILVALIAVIAMIALSRHGWQFLTRMRPGLKLPPGLSLEGSLAIDPRRRVNVISHQGRQLLLLTGGPNDVVIGWLPPPGPESEAPRP